MKVYDFNVKNILGQEISIYQYTGKLLLIVNTASKCGFTPQYDGLEKLYQKYKNRGLVILGFPSNQFLEQEPGTNDEIASFCKLNYGVTFPLFSKVEVYGENADPLFQFLSDAAKFQGFELIKRLGKRFKMLLKSIILITWKEMELNGTSQNS